MRPRLLLLIAGVAATIVALSLPPLLWGAPRPPSQIASAPGMRAAAAYRGALIRIDAVIADDYDAIVKAGARVHARIPGDATETLIATADMPAQAALAEAGFAVAVLDPDAAGRRYYFVLKTIAEATTLASVAGPVPYEDDLQLLVRADDEQAVLALPAQGLALSLLPDYPIALAEPAIAPAVAAAVAPDPFIAGLIAQLTADDISPLIADLSGERAVRIGDQTVTIRTRYSYTSNVHDAERYIYQFYQQRGMAVTYHNYGSSGWRNVIAELPGVERPDQVYYIGGHLDSNSNDPYTYAPGADDNATGVAATMAIADILRAHRFRYTIRFVHFTGEEQGQYGSVAYAQLLSSRGENVLGYINLDMIGWDSDGDRVIELHTGTGAASNGLGTAFIGINDTYGLGLRPERKTTTASRFSDHRAFWDFGYPAFLAIENFFDDAIPRDRNPNYHRTTDRLSAVNLDYVTAYARAALGAIAVLAEPSATTPPSSTATRSPTAVPSPTPTPIAGACRELVTNGDFETTTGWSFGATPRRAAYAANAAHQGNFGARLGIEPPTADAYAYSTVYQTLDLPADAVQITLSFWMRPQSEDSDRDFQEALILNSSYGYLGTALRELNRSGQWRQYTTDLTRYRGQRIVLYFDAFNDGDGYRTWMHLDQVSVLACTGHTTTPTPAATTTPSATATPTPIATATPTATATRTPTPTATPSPTATVPPTPTATPSPAPTATPIPSPTPGLCQELIVNGDFEGATGWTFGATPRRGAYVTTIVHGGQRAARLGVSPDLGDAYSHSTAYQRVALPGSRRITLRYWIWPGSQDSAQDYQEALILDASYRYLGRALRTLRNDQAWQLGTFDLTPFAGRDVVIYFNAFNDGDSRRTWLYLDDVGIQACP